MPTLINKDGFQVIIWTDDHEPAHVHIFRAEFEMIVCLGDESTAVSVREIYGMRGRNFRNALKLIIENQTFLLEKRREIHG